VDTYQIKLASTDQVIHLSVATQEDIEAVSSILTCDWLYFWSRLDPDCEAIVKLEAEGNVQGLIHIALYPYPLQAARPEYLEIIHIETIQSPSRPVNPVGLYLIWYAAKTSLNFDCTGNDSGSIVELDALESAIDYYRDKVMMEGRGWISIAPGEEGYAFRFSQAQAIEFCTRIEQQYGIPSPIGKIG
jgi:hypothetical protein